MQEAFDYFQSLPIWLEYLILINGVAFVWWFAAAVLRGQVISRVLAAWKGKPIAKTPAQTCTNDALQKLISEGFNRLHARLDELQKKQEDFVAKFAQIEERSHQHERRLQNLENKK